MPDDYAPPLLSRDIDVRSGRGAERAKHDYGSMGGTVVRKAATRLHSLRAAFGARDGLLTHSHPKEHERRGCWIAHFAGGPCWLYARKAVPLCGDFGNI